MAAGTISTNLNNNINISLKTHVVSGDKTVKTNVENFNYEEIDYSQVNSTIIATDDNSDFEEWVKTAAATGAVVTTTVASGVAKLAEKIVDGGAWVVGTVGSGILRLFDNDTKAKEFEADVMDFISNDYVGEFNKRVYEGTEIGRIINSNSKLKYDSELAGKIQDFTSDAVLIAGATAATIATGGATAPIIAATFATGFIVGAGDTAEENFKDKENRDFWKDSGEIALDGVLKGASTASVTKVASSAILGIKNLVGAGLKESIKGTLSAFNKDAIKYTMKNTGKTIAKDSFFQIFKEADFYLETASFWAVDIKSAIKTGELDISKMLLETGGVLVGEYIANLTGGILADSVQKIDNIKDIYGEGQVAAREKYNAFFKNFREHADGHSFEVADYARNLAKDVEGIDVDEMVFAAMAHDLGMQGGYSASHAKVRYVLEDGTIGETFETVKVLKKSEGKIKVDGVKAKVLESEQLYIPIDEVNEKIQLNLSDYELSEIARENHPLNSAISVLTEDVIPDGMDRDTVALLAMSHSKSTSGIRHMDSKAEWKACVDKLSETLDQFNADNGTNYSLDTEKLKKMIDKDTDFSRLQKEALLIRDADAMSDITTKEMIIFDEDGEEKYVLSTMMQDGNYSVTENIMKRTSYNDPIVSKTVEAEGLVDSIYTKDGQYVGEVDNDFSKRTHAGELNVNFDSATDGKTYAATIDLNDPNQVPNSSWHSIQERLEEINTYTNCDSRDVIIKLPKDAEGTELGLFYERSLAAAIDNGDIDAAMISDASNNMVSKQNSYNIKIVYEG